MMPGTIEQAAVFPMPDLPPCAIAGAGPLVGRMTGLPASVRSALVNAVGHPIAEAGGRFNPSDVMRADMPGVRFLRAYRVRDLWLVWIEQGGIGHSFRVLGFRDAPHGGSVAMSFPHVPGQSLCAASRAMAVKMRGLR